MVCTGIEGEFVDVVYVELHHEYHRQHQGFIPAMWDSSMAFASMYVRAAASMRAVHARILPAHTRMCSMFSQNRAEAASQWIEKPC